MAFLEIQNVRIAGLSASVPKNIIKNEGDVIRSKDYDASSFVKTTGVIERRISMSLTTGDLGLSAAEHLISELKWNKEEIDALIFVSQTPDYILPATACVLQDKLGLSRNCYATDLSLGCSGWVYGLSNISSLICAANGEIRKALLIVGDAKGRAIVPLDPLFGHAATVTALEFNPNARSLKFNFGTDGSGYDAIIIPDGGSRNPVTEKSFEYEDFEGQQVNGLMDHMKGMDVFSFGITVPPKSIKNLSAKYNFDYQDFDYYVFHQANMKMLNMIIKKLKLIPDKVPTCMAHFGNTSSASIPLTIVTQLREKANRKSMKFLCCGFGVGLSWGTVAFESDDDIVISNLIEVE